MNIVHANVLLVVIIVNYNIVPAKVLLVIVEGHDYMLMRKILGSSNDTFFCHIFEVNIIITNNIAYCHKY